MMFTKRSFFYLFLFLLAAGISACYPLGDDLTYEDLDVAATMYDEDYYTPSGQNDFQDFETFIIPDTIIHIVDEGEDDDISREYDEDIIDLVRSNLISLGLTEEQDPEVNEPDIAVTISAIVSDHTFYTWYPYWDWYWPYYPKGPVADLPENSYYYYPWYPWYGYGSTYKYSTGTLLMEMVDVSRIDPTEEKIPVIWTGLVNGVAGGPVAGLKVRVSGGIDQCFDQSPYLFKVSK